MEEIVKAFSTSLHKGFINKDAVQKANYKPELLINNESENKNVLNSVIHELRTSRSFIFSVAFITEAGLATLKSHLLELKDRGIKGKILTSNYLHFNTPKMFRELLKLENVELRITNLEGFHAKGYIFEQSNYHTLIIGSSNLTVSALKTNYEWNVKLNSLEEGEFVHHFKEQFLDVWEDSDVLTEAWIKAYEPIFKTESVKNESFQNVKDLSDVYSNENSLKEARKIRPNKMQTEALKQIKALRENKKDKGLIISATGTGKTYLSAFDVRAYRPKRMLFIVHREQILLSAMEDFKRVLGGLTSDFGLLSGSRKDLEAKYLFATIQTLSSDSYLQGFNPDDFDYILVDEVHKAGASSYLKVLNYFKPKFLLGMTATPERTDDFNIYKLFDYNIAYEIRLQEALEEDMLCPFHYFGVTDLEYIGERTEDVNIFRRLVTEERVDHLIEKISYYGYSGDQVKGLMFCSRKDEAKKLSEALNKRGYRTAALTGEDNQNVREEVIEQLELGALDYILTVDIFNEGIDIPSLNQIVMLRQTKSSIIFIQQLGRGLRKHPSKDYVTIIDFIGNYTNNYLIPIALSGDGSQNKDNLRRHVQDTSYIKGVSNINFEEIARKRIFESIKEANLTSMKIFDEAYTQLKNKIGRVPYLYDFLIYNSLDPLSIVSKFSNHYRFLLREEKYDDLLNSYEDSVLTMFSLEFMNGKRIHELILLDLLLNKNLVTFDMYKDELKSKDIFMNEGILESVRRIFELDFFTKTDIKKYGSQPILVYEDDHISFNQELGMSLQKDSYKKLVLDVVKTGLEKSKQYDHQRELTLYEKYTKKDVCRLLNWHKDEKGTMYGYRTKHGTTPIFITYHKHDDVDTSVDYGDEFLNRDTLLWYTRNQRTLESKEIKEIIDRSYGNQAHIFVKKDDDEGTDFYYLGKAKPIDETIEQTYILGKEGKELDIVRMNLELEEEIDPALYDYLIDE